MDEHADFSRAGLMTFLETMASQGLANSNTVLSIRTACSKILVDLSDAEEVDVRKVDIPLSIRKFNNKNPGTLSPSSLAEYQRRVALAIREFELYQSDPTAYKGIGSGKPRVAKGEVSEKRSGPRPKPSTTTPRQSGETDAATHAPPINSSGLSFAFPLRADFLAQLVLPRDMKTEEALRLCAFVRALAVDFDPA